MRYSYLYSTSDTVWRDQKLETKAKAAGLKTSTMQIVAKYYEVTVAVNWIKFRKTDTIRNDFLKFTKRYSAVKLLDIRITCTTV